MIIIAFNGLMLFHFCCSLSKHLSSKKGSRTSNCGNRLEFAVLTFIQNVPWINQRNSSIPNWQKWYTTIVTVVATNHWLPTRPFWISVHHVTHTAAWSRNCPQAPRSDRNLRCQIVHWPPIKWSRIHGHSMKWSRIIDSNLTLYIFAEFSNSVYSSL